MICTASMTHCVLLDTAQTFCRPLALSSRRCVPQVWLVRSAGLSFVAHRSGANTGITLHINPEAQEAKDVAVRRVARQHLPRFVN